MMRNIILLIFIALTLCACYSSNRPAVEAPPVAYQPTPQSTPIQLTNVPGPKQSEVQEAVKRVFKDAAVVDTNYNPSFLSGDFNGDGSQDLAVILKPAKLDLMNQELPPWLVRQPRANKVARAHVPIAKDETFLAVIHGFGANNWRDPDATAAAFAGGWFHTGDIGVRDEDGYLFIVDRLKDMIVSGGENIAGSEVERVLYEHDDVVEAAVVGRPDERWGEVPVAHVVVREGATATAEDLIQHCRSQLAGFKVPKDITFLDALPRNPSGKVLKRELRVTS